MVSTLLEHTELVDFKMQVDGVCCHEQDDNVDEASILVEQSLQHIQLPPTMQMLSDVQVPTGKGSDAEKTELIWR